MKRFLIFFLIAYSPLLTAKRIFPGYKFKEGQTFEYELTQDQHLKLTVIKLAGEIEQSNTYKMYFEVKEAQKNEVNLIFKISAVEINVKDLNGSQQLSTPGPTQGLDSLIQKYIINRSYFIRMDNFGNTVSITPPDLQIKPYDMDTLKFDALMEFADKQNIKSLINEVFMVYPRNDIFPGDSWNNINYLDAGLPVTATSSIQIASAEKKENIFRIKGKFTDNSIKNYTANTIDGATKISGLFSGKIITSPKNGLLRKKEWSGNFEGETWVEGNKVLMKNSLEFTLKRIN